MKQKFKLILLAFPILFLIVFCSKENNSRRTLEDLPKDKQEKVNDLIAVRVERKRAISELIAEVTEQKVLKSQFYGKLDSIFRYYYVVQYKKEQQLGLKLRDCIMPDEQKKLVKKIMSMGSPTGDPRTNCYMACESAMSGMIESVEDWWMGMLEDCDNQKWEQEEDCLKLPEGSSAYFNCLSSAVADRGGCYSVATSEAQRKSEDLFYEIQVCQAGCDQRFP